MTLDELLDSLLRLKRESPAAGLARIVGPAWMDVRYERGEVHIWPEMDIEVEGSPEGVVH